MTILRAAMLVGFIGILTAAASADTKLAVELGWEGKYTVGRWSPIFITAVDSQPRNVIVDVYVPHDQIHAMQIHQLVSIGPQPTRFAVFAPFVGQTDDMNVTLRDAHSDKRLAYWSPLDNPQRNLSYQPVKNIIAITGRDGTQQLLKKQLTGSDVQSCWINPLDLPYTPQGYDSIALLVLNQPDLNRINNEQQQAIVDWVHAGGQLLCTLSEDAQPAGPILDALPALVGDNIVVDVPVNTIKQIGLPGRFRKLKGRQLSPLPDVQKIDLFNGTIAAYRRTLGFGSVVVLPVDVSEFLFNSERNAQQWWKPLTVGAIDWLPSDEQLSSRYYYNSQDPALQSKSAAITKAMDQLGDVPGVGAFGFSYIAIVIVGMMLVVGPIDWIVLKKLGRQPWTWATTSGCIALVTLGAVYVGHVFRSGDLHFRTLRIVDQADNMIAATTDAVGVYSPRTSDYRVSGESEGWWEPMALYNIYNRNGIRSDVDFHQDYHGNVPEPMQINVWNLRFLSNQKIAPAPPIIEASLHYEYRDGHNRIAGSITNHGQVALTQIWIRVKNGVCLLANQTIEPGATIPVDQPFTDNDSRFRPSDQNTYYYYGYNNPAETDKDSIWDLSDERSQRIQQAIDWTNTACIYARSNDDAPPIATLSQPPKFSKNWLLVRALIKLEKP